MSFFGLENSKKETQSYLAFRKYIFLPNDLEELDYKVDAVKQNLVVH